MLRTSAREGDVDAQFELGRMLEDGGVEMEQDEAAAARWFELAASQGDGEAAYRLACMHEEGRGFVDPDDAKAALWYRVAASKGHAEAMYCLATLYLHGEGVEQSDREAVTLFAAAEKLGHARAAFNLGTMYGQGSGGLVKSEVRAVELWTVAASKDDIPEAHFMLAQARERGMGGLAKDPKGALRDFEASLARGFAPAATEVARLAASLDQNLHSLCSLPPPGEPSGAAEMPPAPGASWPDPFPVGSRVQVLVEVLVEVPPPPGEALGSEDATELEEVKSAERPSSSDGTASLDQRNQIAAHALPGSRGSVLGRVQSTGRYQVLLDGRSIDGGVVCAKASALRVLKA
mmetsp:Transcript_25823/g.57896  ORF Transcript_25823/g.57896 Transcript_25823/m.57896 type:complete len:348 (-) Transcript_25823:162-1205(-)